MRRHDAQVERLAIRGSGSSVSFGNAKTSSRWTPGITRKRTLRSGGRSVVIHGEPKSVRRPAASAPRRDRASTMVSERLKRGATRALRRSREIALPTFSSVVPLRPAATCTGAPRCRHGHGGRECDLDHPPRRQRTDGKRQPGNRFVTDRLTVDAGRPGCVERFPAWQRKTKWRRAPRRRFRH